MSYKKVLFSLIVFLLFSFLSCENTIEKNNKTITPDEDGPSFILDEVINKMIYDQSTGPIDAYQIVARSLGVINVDDPQIIPYTDDYCASIYKIVDRAEFIEYSKCKGYTLNPKLGFFPHKYFLDWASTPINPGELIFWEFKYPGLPVVNTSIPMPLDFGDFDVNTNPVDLSQGCVLTWDNNGPEDLILAATLSYRHPTNGTPMGGSRTSFIGFIPNSGSYTVTSQLLTELGADSLCINVSFYLGKANIKINKFDNETKQVATVGYVEQTLSVPAIAQ